MNQEDHKMRYTETRNDVGESAHGVKGAVKRKDKGVRECRFLSV